MIADDPDCYRPDFLHNVPVSQVEEFDFTCLHDYYDYYYDTDYDVDDSDYDELSHFDTHNNNYSSSPDN